MEYNGKYIAFNPNQIKTYPINTRTNKVKLEDIIAPERALKDDFKCEADIEEKIQKVAKAIIDSRKDNKPVICFSGAHLIKNGLGLLICDLVKKDLITLFAGNGATAIHDFELALIGQTSEYVPQALEKGQFGLAYEFAYQNTAIQLGNQYKLGYGESLGRMICDEQFRTKVLNRLEQKESQSKFNHHELSILAACYTNNIPFTVHVGIGTDVIDQHDSFDGCAKGGCSGRDFLIYTQEITKLIAGGVVLNIGSAVTGPEVFLKAASMAGNIGKVPNNIVTADFDLRNYGSSQMTNEAAESYYFRDQKSVVTRVPQAFNGIGYYVQGNQKTTIPILYKTIMRMI
jgi:hypothetical protein